MFDVRAAKSYFFFQAAKRRLCQIASRATYVRVRHKQVPWNIFKKAGCTNQKPTRLLGITEMWV